MFKNFNHILILSLPFLFKYLFLFLFIDFNLFDREDIIEDFFFLIIIVFLLYSDVIKKHFFRDTVCFTYILYLILETSSYMAVSSNFSSSYMYLLLESNREELKEFAMSYISIPIALFIFSIVSLFFVIRKHNIKTSNKYRSVICVFGVFGMVIILKLTGLIESNAYHNIVRGAYGYYELQNSIKFNSEISESDLIISTENDVLVLVIGESTSRGHMQLYGYNRETTPLLNSIKDSLFIYNEVISTDVFTLKAVPKMLSSLEVDSSKKELINIVQVFNSAGYKTFWLANQRPISYHDNAINKIASASNQFKFYNYKDDTHTNILDEIIFTDYKEIISQTGKKVIFVKLIGTHFEYNKRYPEAFNKFVSEKDRTSKEEQIINHYDNAVLYNDFIVYTLIKNLEKINSKSALLYISDHGENVYDSGTDFFGRSEEVPTQSMFEIPFILWTSKDFNSPKDFIYDPNRKFMADHAYESIGHVFGVRHKNMNLEHSIFSESFKERKRKVINRIDFDSYFSIQNE